MVAGRLLRAPHCRTVQPVPPRTPALGTTTRWSPFHINCFLTRTGVRGVGERRGCYAGAAIGGATRLP